MLKFVRFADLPVLDQDRAISFYTEKLGLNVTQDAPYKDGWRWVELQIPGAQTKVLLTERPDGADTDVPRLVIDVDDVNASYLDLKGKGVVFTQEPTQAPWDPGQTFALFRDSEGNIIMIGSG